MKITEIISNLAIQSGVPADNAAFKTIIGNTALASIEVDEDLSKMLIASRITMDAAKANPDLKKHFRKEVYDGLDAEISRTMGEFELPDEVKTEIGAEVSHFKKVSLLAKRVKDLETKKVGATTGDKDKLNDQIKVLNDQAAALKSSFLTEKESLIAGFENERIDMTLGNMLSAFTYATPKEVPMDVNVTMGKTIVNGELLKKGLKVVKKDGVLKLQTSEGTDYFENNVAPSLNDFVQKSLANAKILSASKAGAGPTNQGVITVSTSNGNTLNTSDYDKASDSSMAELTRNEKVT